MTKEELLNKQKEIDEEIINIWGKEASLDGITDIDTYLKNELHTLWILKETNRDMLPKENFNQREFNKCGSGWGVGTYTNIMKTNIGIREYAASDGQIKMYEKNLPKLVVQNGNRDFKSYYSEISKCEIFPMDEVAMINIHKGIGGRSSDNAFIAAQYNRPEVRKIILEQVEYINPKLIIVCNKVEKLLCDLAGVESITSFRDGDDGAKFYNNGKRLIISVGHPLIMGQKGMTSEKYCNSILDIVYNEL